MFSEYFRHSLFVELRMPGKRKGKSRYSPPRNTICFPRILEAGKALCAVPSWGLEPSITHSLYVTAFLGARPWREQLFLLRPMGIKPLWAIVRQMPSSWKNEGEVWLAHTAFVLSLCGISVGSRRYPGASLWVSLIELLERTSRNTDIHKAFTRLGKHVISFKIYFRILHLWGSNFKKLTIY